MNMFKCTACGTEFPMDSAGTVPACEHEPAYNYCMICGSDELTTECLSCMGSKKCCECAGNKADSDGEMCLHCNGNGECSSCEGTGWLQ